MDDKIEKRNYQTLLEYVMYNFYVSCPYNPVDGSDLTNLEVSAMALGKRFKYCEESKITKLKEFETNQNFLIEK